MEEISKSFPGVQALKNVNLMLYEREILALVGENGAGKSTLMKILNGVYEKDNGSIYFDNKEVSISDPAVAQNLGISSVYQEFNLVPTGNIAENIFIGRLPKNKIGLINSGKLLTKTREIINIFGLHLSPQDLVSSLSVAEQQVVEILKALTYDSKIIIMDEPTSALSFSETRRLFDIICSLRDKGVSIIYISHRLEEIFEIADRVMVLRDGKNAGEMDIKEAKIEKVIKLMVGREIKDIFPSRSKHVGTAVMSVNHLTSVGKFYDISFELHSGEILGIAGLVGAGRTELAEAIFGASPPESGEIVFSGASVNIRNPQEAIKLGIGMVPENRHEAGLILAMSIRENISLITLDEMCKFSVIMKRLEAQRALKAFTQLDIRAPSIETSVMSISGGNQQKVILARWLQISPKVLILDEPTRGIDVGAKTEIFNLIRKLADNGVAVLMINSELPEILGLSDRILIMSAGKLTGEFTGGNVTPEEIMTRATMKVKVT
jgi:ABC-type sugar transport system ATPase subunit